GTDVGEVKAFFQFGQEVFIDAALEPEQRSDAGEDTARLAQALLDLVINGAKDHAVNLYRASSSEPRTQRSGVSGGSDSRLLRCAACAARTERSYPFQLLGRHGAAPDRAPARPVAVAASRYRQAQPGRPGAQLATAAVTHLRELDLDGPHAEAVQLEQAV